jgi:hypothetical protein
VVFVNLPQGGDFLLGRDIVVYAAARFELISRMIRSHQLPLWNPFDQAGMPLYGDPVIMIFYTPMWPMYFFFNVSYLTVLTFFHIVFAGFFAYLLARKVGISQTGSVMSAVVYMFSGQLLSRIYAGHIQHIATLVFFPVILLLAMKTLRDKNKILNAILLAFAMVLCLTAGHFQFFFYIIISLFVYIIFEFLQFARRREVPKFLRGGAYLLLAGIIFLLISFPYLQLAVTYAKYVGTGLRGNYEFATEGSLHPLLLPRFVFPNLYGYNDDTYFFYTYYSENPYTSLFGIVSAVAVIVALLCKRERKKLLALEKFFLTLFLLAIFFMFGKYNPFYFLFYKFVPGFAIFRLPTRFMMLTTLSMSMLAGFNLDCVFRNENRRRTTRILYKILGVLSFFSLGLTALLWGFRDLIARKLLQIYAQMAASKVMVDINYPFVLERVSMILRTNMLYIGLALAIIILSLWVISYRNSKAKYFFVALVFADLMLMLPFPKFGTLERTFKPNPVEIFLINQNPSGVLGSYRTFELVPWGQEPYVRDYVAHKYRIETATWSGQSVALSHYYQYIYPVFYGNLTDLETIDKLRMLNVKYVIAHHKISSPEFEERFSATNVSVYELKDFRPRISLLGTNGSIDVIEHTENQIQLNVVSQGEGEAFFSEIYYPTWKATLNGKLASIRQCYGPFRCIDIEKGQNSIKMTDMISNSWLTLGISIAMILCCTAAIAYLFLRPRP